MIENIVNHNVSRVILLSAKLRISFHMTTRCAIPTMHLVLPISTDKKFCPTREILCRGDRNEKHKDFPRRREVVLARHQNRLSGTSAAIFRNNLLAPDRQVTYTEATSIRCRRWFACRFQRALERRLVSPLLHHRISNTYTYSYSWRVPRPNSKPPSRKFPDVCQKLEVYSP